jgi:hypothetical protein
MGLWACAFFLGQFLSPAVVGLARTLTGGGILSAFVVMGGIAIFGSLVAVAPRRIK